MDLEDQWKLATLIDQYGSDQLTVLIGCPDAESSQIQAETVSVGDPSLSGPLTNRELKLCVLHVVEHEVKKVIPQHIYQKHVAQFITRVDSEAIIQRMNELRERTGFRGAKVLHSQRVL